MRTPEMTSRSFIADFCLDEENQLRRLTYSYDSDPIVTVRERSSPHKGTVLLDLVGSPVRKLRGSYWTDRGTLGTIEFTLETWDRWDDLPETVAPDEGKSSLRRIAARCVIYVGSTSI